LGSLKQIRQDKNLLYWHDEPNKPNKEFLYHMYFPFASVSTVSRGHPSLVSLVPSLFKRDLGVY
jgi:hypothetical protein